VQLDGFVVAYGNANGSSSNGYGGGIYCNGTSPVIRNCIISDCNAIYNGGGHFSEFSYCCIKDSNGSGANWDSSLGIDGGENTAYDPCFVNPSDPNGDDNKLCTSDDGLRLEADSPCIDAGNNPANNELWDIAEINRKLISRTAIAVDMGAYEFGVISLPVHFSGWGIRDYWDTYLGVEPPFADGGLPPDTDPGGDIRYPGLYLDTSIIIQKSISDSLDSIAVSKNTRLIIYSGKDFTGDITLDITGPAIVINCYRRNLYSGWLEDWQEPYNTDWPSDIRYWSDDATLNVIGDCNMYSSEGHSSNWVDGSFKILSVE